MRVAYRMLDSVAEAEDNPDEPGLQVSEFIDNAGPVVFEHACRLGLEGIVRQ